MHPPAGRVEPFLDPYPRPHQTTAVEFYRPVARLVTSWLPAIGPPLQPWDEFVTSQAQAIGTIPSRKTMPGVNSNGRHAGQGPAKAEGRISGRRRVGQRKTGSEAVTP